MACGCLDLDDGRLALAMGNEEAGALGVSAGEGNGCSFGADVLDGHGALGCEPVERE
jgi:hypothetical protein